MAETDPGARVGPDAGIVRPAVGNWCDHRFHEGEIDAPRGYDAGNPAHVVVFRTFRLPPHQPAMFALTRMGGWVSTGKGPLASIACFA